MRKSVSGSAPLSSLPQPSSRAKPESEFSHAAADRHRARLVAHILVPIATQMRIEPPSAVENMVQVVVSAAQSLCALHRRKHCADDATPKFTHATVCCAAPATYPGHDEGRPLGHVAEQKLPTGSPATCAIEVRHEEPRHASPGAQR